MNKTGKYAINGAIIFGIINALLNVARQFNEIEKKPQLKFDWKRMFGAAGKGAVVGGIGGAVVGAIVDHNNSQVKAINTDAHLNNYTGIIKLDKNDPQFIRLDQKATLLSDMFQRKYGAKIKSMPRLGSTENGTALKEKFDIDFSINFKPNSFQSTEKMFDSVLSFLRSQIGKSSIVDVRSQRKSIGVFVKINGQEHKIDVVPCKLTRGASGSGYLYVNDNSVFGRPSYTKTNIQILNSQKLSSTQQKVAVVLKKWKIKNDLPLSSHLLQNLILDAYAYATRVPSGITEKVMMVLNHIANSLDVAVIRGEENGNNIITNIPQTDKDQIIRAAKETIDEYRYQPNSILSTLI